jgi:predicted DNA-binding protein (UPF0251 family)
MPRPPRCRMVANRPRAAVFRPAGIPAGKAGTVLMTLDEYEAVRLADLEGLHQDRAARQMGVSRPTFSRIVESARRKEARALVRGMALMIRGGPVHLGRRGSSCGPSCPCPRHRTRACTLRAGGSAAPGGVALPEKEGGSCRCARRPGMPSKRIHPR